MQDLEKLREIEEWGQEEEQPLSEEPTESAGNPLPLIQAAVCLLLLAGLLLLRATDQPIYHSFAQWYQQEASQEIQLPAWEGEAAPTPSPSPSPSPSPAPEAVPTPGVKKLLYNGYEYLFPAWRLPGGGTVLVLRLAGILLPVFGGGEQRVFPGCCCLP